MHFGHRVGILGGGQLARMLILQGQRMGLEMHVLCESSSEPAAQVTSFHQKGSPRNEADLLKFFKKVDLVTFESEFYEGHGLQEIEDQTQTAMFPGASVICRLQDRLPQKELLDECNVPTAAFMAIHNFDDLRGASTHFEKLVLKKRFGGYDGNGTFIVSKPLKSHEDLAEEFPDLDISKEKFIAEAFVPFKRELALMLVRNRSGDAIHFPLVETKQSQNRCDWVFGPVEHRGKNSLLKKLFLMLEKVNYVGAIGFELFDTGSELLVNEVAPRVHNSGHYSMDALSEDQFSYHLRAILDLPLRRPTPLSKNFVMTNLVGLTHDHPQFPKHLTGKLHWYGKSENRPGRKMGHINYLGSGRGLLMKALKERKLIRGL